MKSNKDWNDYGDNDPYFGVLSEEKYKSTNITDDKFKEFYETGAVYVEETNNRILGTFNKAISEMDILDFGCGVGRLAIPFARKTSGKVLGLDVSQGMINLAKAQHEQHHLNNLQYLHYAGEHIPEIGSFDLVNSYIVIQHIEPSVGYGLVEQLCKRAKIGGFIHLQIPYGHQIPKLRYLKFYLKVNNDFYNKFANWLKTGKFERTPVMQMNSYCPKKLEKIFYKYTDAISREGTNHGGILGNIYFFKRVK